MTRPNKSCYGDVTVHEVRDALGKLVEREIVNVARDVTIIGMHHNVVGDLVLRLSTGQWFTVAMFGGF